MQNLLDFLAAFVVVNVWELIVIAFGLWIIKTLRDDIRPLFVGMITPLQRQAQTNAVTWALAIILAVLSMIGAIKEVADTMHWVYLGFACKILNAPLALLVAMIKQAQSEKDPKPAAPPGTTTPPFPTTATAAAPTPSP